MNLGSDFLKPSLGTNIGYKSTGEFGTCCDRCDRTVYYSGKMQNVLYSVEMPNSLGAELTRIPNICENVSIISEQPSYIIFTHFQSIAKC